MNPESFWIKTAQRQARKRNSAWVLDLFGPALAISSLLIGAALLLYRSNAATQPSPTLVTIALTTAILPALGFAYFRARKKFITPEVALVHLEAKLGLNNRLTAAHQGIGPWPEPRQTQTGEHWNWPRLAIAPSLLLAFLTAALFIPLQQSSAASDPTAEPAALREIETSLAKLAREDLVQEDYLEEMEKRLEELREKNADDWFSHSSLEATDSLREAHRGELGELERSLKKSEKSLQTLQKHSDQLTREQRQQLANEFNQALKKMEEGAMKPNQKLLEQLGGIDPQNLNQLNPEQLDQLRQNMRQLADQLGDARGGDQPGEGDGEGQGEGEGEENGEGEGQNPGAGGINRGPGHAPGVLGDQGPDTNLGKLERLEASDLSNTLPGDLLQTDDSEHEVDESAVGPRAGGAIQSPGQGGDRVWRQSLLPEEQRAVKGFFK